MTAERSYQFTSAAPPAKPVAVDTPGVRAAARPRAQVYWFHPDHLGTGTLITDLEGRPHQFFLNLPYGETFIEQGGYRYDNPYKFNGKELDPETGLYYYGARYYDPKISLWLSVDPLAEKYPGMSHYNYTAGNPVVLVDPDGRCFTRNKEGFFVPCPTKEVKDYGVGVVVEQIADGTTRRGYFGYEWIMKDGEWQLNNGVDPKSVKYKYIHVEADGSPEYYVKRYIAHIENFGTRPPDYYLEYGYNNIILFKNYKWKTEIGRKWMEQTAKQLQVLMNIEIDRTPSIQGNNKEFTDMAYETHYKAYTFEDTILQLSQTPDIIAIPFIPKFKHSFGSLRGWDQITDMIIYFYYHSDVFSPDNPGYIKPYEPKF